MRRTWAALLAVAIAWAGASIWGAEKDGKPAPAESRAPVPERAAVAVAAKRVRNAVASEYAQRSPAARAALGKKLLDLTGNENDPVAQFALLEEAREVAAGAGDFATAAVAADLTGKRFSVQSADLKLAVLQRAHGKALSPEAARSGLKLTMQLTDAEIAANRYEVAVKAVSLGEGFAASTGDAAVEAAVKSRATEVRKMPQQYGRVKTVLNTTGGGDDPKDNLLAGRFLCFSKEDWDKGLPMLANGSDVKLKTLAAHELQNPSEGSARVKLADGWWEAAAQEAEPVKTRVQAHACRWYAAALPDLTGLRKAEMEKRVALGEDASRGLAPWLAAGSSSGGQPLQALSVGDGQFEDTEEGGQPLHRGKKGGGGRYPRYMYFVVPDEVRQTKEPVYVEVTYQDIGTGHFALSYNATRERDFQDATPAFQTSLTNSREIRVAAFKLAEPDFRKSQANVADLRLDQPSDAAPLSIVKAELFLQPTPLYRQLAAGKSGRR